MNDNILVSLIPSIVARLLRRTGDADVTFANNCELGCVSRFLEYSDSVTYIVSVLRKLWIKVHDVHARRKVCCPINTKLLYFHSKCDSILQLDN
jgi:hypothetical protein